MKKPKVVYSLPKGQLAGLLSNPEIEEINVEIVDDYKRISEQLSSQTDSLLMERLKAYDDFSRFTFGRAITGLMECHELQYRLPDQLEFTVVRKGDPNIFPSPLHSSNYPGVCRAISYITKVLVNDVPPKDRVMLSVYCHRVVIEPGGVYRGFYHRDNKPGEKCGTAVWYPQILHDQFKGVDLKCFLNRPGWTDKDLISSTADFQFQLTDYREKVMLMKYPHNLLHGVTRGAHTYDVSGSNKPNNIRRFLQSSASVFLKDLVIITISSHINAED
jgi:hypothetical protein